MPAMNRTLEYPIISTLQYWLVNHPKILHFSWNQGQTTASSPRFLTLTILSYLFFTYLLSQELPRWPPLPRRLLKSISAIHNFTILTLSLTMAVGCSLSIFSYSPNFPYIICFPKSTTATGPLFFWAYIFYLSKILEFMDTLLIILSNSIQRLTFLHVYHHTMVLTMCYIGLSSAQSCFPIGLITNCMVHVFMYSYYLLTSLGIRPRWKRMVTDCQLLQFWSSFGFLALLLYFHFTGSGCSGIWSWCFNIFFISTLLVLFTDFHTKTYSLKTKGV
ncbi:hypothetical protein SLE2022_145140 [Rubroshorea leprosula]